VPQGVQAGRGADFGAGGELDAIRALACSSRKLAAFAAARLSIPQECRCRARRVVPSAIGAAARAGKLALAPMIPQLRTLVARYPWCTIEAGLSDAALASQLAADPAACVRPGFGLVLLEAQAAGTPVVGPAHGGSRDA
jgi:hypothetical protein